MYIHVSLGIECKTEYWCSLGAKLGGQSVYNFLSVMHLLAGPCRKIVEFPAWVLRDGGPPLLWVGGFFRCPPGRAPSRM
jgi:hypothetical protein